MANFAYKHEGLTDGADAHQGVSETADLAVTVLSQLPVVPAVFGSVATAAAFGAAADRARLGYGRRIAVEVSARADLARRAGKAAWMGLELIGDTTKLATSVSPKFRPGSILEGMGR